ncbi:general stress protein [Peribacillus sp. SI8-4]|uniref:general stress protein n=1 Tax=Peribacillus sp. SI8-4 TaxID=3048009 RepID=UPI002555C4E4|nr:general stress protein [Peribacillus sp. SI8-4]
MGKALYGIYDSKPEVYQAIQSLTETGRDEREITVIANKKEDFDFGSERKDHEVDVVTNASEESFLDKLKHFFLNEGTGDIRNRLGEFGLADSEATAYINEVEAGKFLILIDDQAAASNDMHDDEYLAEDPLKTGVVNNPDPNLFPETTANAYQTPEVEAQPGRSKELHGNSADIFENHEELNTKRAQEREIRSNSTERYKQQEKTDFEGTLTSDPHADPFSADTGKALDEDRSVNRNVKGEEDPLKEDYIKNRINTDHL